MPPSSVIRTPGEALFESHSETVRKIMKANLLVIDICSFVRASCNGCVEADARSFSFFPTLAILSFCFLYTISKR